MMADLDSRNTFSCKIKGHFNVYICVYIYMCVCVCVYTHLYVVCGRVISALMKNGFVVDRLLQTSWGLSG
jgi:hypothetical protein